MAGDKVIISVFAVYLLFFLFFVFFFVVVVVVVVSFQWTIRWHRVKIRLRLVKPAASRENLLHNKSSQSYKGLSCPHADYVDHHPAGTCRRGNVVSTSMQRHDVPSTLMRRCINAMCLLGKLSTEADRFSNSEIFNTALYSEIPLSRPAKMKTSCLLKTLFANFIFIFSSFSTPSVSIIRHYLWDCSKVVL